MHIQHIGVAGGLQGLLRHPIGGEELGPLRDQVLLAHGGPDVAVDHIRVLHVVHVVGDLNEAAVFPGGGKGGLDDLRIHLLCQLLRADAHKVHTHLGSADHPGVTHVVPHVAGEHHLHLVQGLVAVLLNGHHVRQDLGGVVRVGEAVPHGHAGVFGQVLHGLLVVAPVLDAVKKPAQHLGGVLQGLLLAHLGAARVQIGDMGPLLGGRHLEGAAGAGGGLFKQQHDVLALEGRVADAGPALGFQVVAQVQEIADLRGGEVLERQEAPAFQIDCHTMHSFFNDLHDGVFRGQIWAAGRRPILVPRMPTGPPATGAWTCTWVRPGPGTARRWEWCGAGSPPPPAPGW